MVAYPLLRADIPESKGEIMGDPINSAVAVERGGVALIERFYYYAYCVLFNLQDEAPPLQLDRLVA